jgi:hypothetical protein
MERKATNPLPTNRAQQNMVLVTITSILIAFQLSRWSIWTRTVTFRALQPRVVCENLWNLLIADAVTYGVVTGLHCLHCTTFVTMSPDYFANLPCTERLRLPTQLAPVNMLQVRNIHAHANGGILLDPDPPLPSMISTRTSALRWPAMTISRCYWEHTPT